MTAKHRIRADQLQVGAPLPVDVYNAENRLLLRRGNIIATDSQLERLIEHGLFSDQPLPSRPREVPKPTTRVSVYAEVVHAGKTLEALLAAPEANPDFGASIGALADTVRRGCALDPDAALAHILFARDMRYPIRQSINVAVITALLPERTNNDRVRTQSAVCAALTMNLSMLAVRDVLYRQQSMTDEQRNAVATHPEVSAQNLAALGVTDPVWLTLVEQHHEFIDGSGFPNKLAGVAVAREAQVIGLADRYCGVVTERAYRPAVAPDVAITQIRTKSGAAIDPALIAELVRWIGMYPPGTVVELFNRDVAVVTRRLRDPKHPVVFAVSGQNLRPYKSPRKRMTAGQPQFHIERVFPRDTIKFPVDRAVFWPRTVTEDAVIA